jgi:hypothetical protein
VTIRPAGRQRHTRRPPADTNGYRLVSARMTGNDLVIVAGFVLT